LALLDLLAFAALLRFGLAFLLGFVLAFVLALLGMSPPGKCEATF
jgi:predicted exporter